MTLNPGVASQNGMQRSPKFQVLKLGFKVCAGARVWGFKVLGGRLQGLGFKVWRGDLGGRGFGYQSPFGSWRLGQVLALSRDSPFCSCFVMQNGTQGDLGCSMWMDVVDYIFGDYSCVCYFTARPT